MLPYGWVREAHFLLTVVHRRKPNKTIVRYARHDFEATARDYGFRELVPIEEIEKAEDKGGFLHEGTLTLQVKVWPVPDAMSRPSESSSDSHSSQGRPIDGLAGQAPPPPHMLRRPRRHQWDPTRRAPSFEGAAARRERSQRSRADSRRSSAQRGERITGESRIMATCVRVAHRPIMRGRRPHECDGQYNLFFRMCYNAIRLNNNSLTLLF